VKEVVKETAAKEVKQVVKETAGKEVRETIKEKTSSTYENITKESRGKESVRNIKTDATQGEVSKTLKEQGYKETLSKDGKATQYTKDGKKYVIRSDVQGNPTLDTKKPGTNETIIKTRLEQNK